MRIFLIVMWSLCYIGMNLGAKYLTLSMAPDQGILKLILSTLRCWWLYIFLITAAGTAVFYLWLLKLMPLSIAGAIVSALGILLVVFTGVLLCRESPPDLRQTAGIVLTLAGIILLQSGGPK